MATREQLSILLQDLGRTIGLVGLALDDDGLCALKIGETATINLHASDDKQSPVMFSSLGQINDAWRHAALTEMLSANVIWRGTRGGSLAYDPPSNTALLMLRLNEADLYLERFEPLLTAFVADVTDWTDRLANMRTEKTRPSRDTGEDLPFYSIRV